jgi:UPF0755 protein
MKLVIKMFFVLIIICILSLGGFYLAYKNGIKSVSNDKTSIEFNVKDGSNFYNIVQDLKSKDLIKSEFFYKLYIKFNQPGQIQKGIYELNKSMTVSDIIKTLQGKSKNPNEIVMTFKEGYDMKDIIKVITKHTNNTEEDVLNKLKDTNYLNSLINKYWFIDSSILNNQLYYSLEGYLYPNTYQFKDKKVSVEEIFNKMIAQMDKKLTDYKSNIEGNKYSFHQLLTLASIVELEGLNIEDRNGIASVFYNRLNSNMNLGSDVTTYYGAKVEMGDRDLYMNEITANNGYNTRSNSMMGKLPIGPISNPSIESIAAVLNPTQSDYYYFVSDKKGKSYFSKTLNEHNQIIAKLKSEGLWYEY